MKATFLRSALAVILMIAAHAVKAQAVITEYFDVKSGFKVDLTDKKISKAIYTKGVLDIDWNNDKRILAVSYNPKETNVEDILSNISALSGIALAPNSGKKKG